MGTVKTGRGSTGTSAFHTSPAQGTARPALAEKDCQPWDFNSRKPRKIHV